MLKKIIKVAILLIAVCLILVFFILGVPRLITGVYSFNKIFTTQESPEAPVAIVFGAGLNRDGTPTSVLRHRVRTAAELYFEGKVEKLLMSGDNRFIEYNEPGAMFEYAVNLGVDPDDIVLDYAGRRTYDTCYRAEYIFGIENAILVTQNFHLPRAIFLCNSLGVEAVGVKADQREYRKLALLYWNFREIPATLVALWETWISHPLPVLGEKEPIEFSITSDQNN